jgi:hypothetical protein
MLARAEAARNQRGMERARMSIDTAQRQHRSGHNDDREADACIERLRSTLANYRFCPRSEDRFSTCRGTGCRGHPAPSSTSSRSATRSPSSFVNTRRLKVGSNE